MKRRSTSPRLSEVRQSIRRALKGHSQPGDSSRLYSAATRYVRSHPKRLAGFLAWLKEDRGGGA